MSPKHQNVKYTNLNSPDSSPIIKKKQISGCSENDCLKLDLLLASNEIEAESISKRENARWKKRTSIILILFLFALSVSYGIYQNAKHQAENPEKLKCGDKFSVSDIERIENQHKSVDIAFLLEWSSKNFKNVDVISQNLDSLVENMKNKFNDAKIRVAIIAYRSFLDKDGEFKISNFTTNMSEIRSFLNNLNPTEDTIANEDVLDVLGSIDKSLSLDWQAANKLLFQIGVSTLKGFCNFDCPDQANSYATSELNEMFVKLNTKCIIYNIIQVDDTQDLLVEEIREIGKPFKEPETFNVYNMKKEGFNFSEISSAVIASIDRKLESLHLYFNADCDSEVNVPTFKKSSSSTLWVDDTCLNV